MSTLEDTGHLLSSISQSIGLGEPPIEKQTCSERLLRSIDKWFTLSYFQRIAGFIICLSTGCIFFVLSFFYVSNILLGAPQKFAVSYTFANLFLHLSLLFLVGIRQQVKNMMTHKRWLASIIYLLSMIMTLYSAIEIGSWYLTLIMLIVQICALVWYFSSYIPFMQNILATLCGWTFGSILPI